MSLKLKIKREIMNAGGNKNLVKYLEKKKKKIKL